MLLLVAILSFLLLGSTANADQVSSPRPGKNINSKSSFYRFAQTSSPRLIRASSVNQVLYSDKPILRQEDASAETTDSSANDTSETNSTEPGLSPYEYTMRNVYWFNRGFKGDELAANFSNCIERGPYWYFWELETYQIKLRYADFGEQTFNSTLFA